MMLGHANPLFVNADIAYRRAQLTTDMHRARRPLHLRWPIGLISPNRRRPRIAPRPMPSPHHVTSH